MTSSRDFEEVASELRAFLYHLGTGSALGPGSTHRSYASSWLAEHGPSYLDAGSEVEQGIIGDLYYALSDSQELGADFPLAESASAVLEELGTAPNYYIHVEYRGESGDTVFESGISVTAPNTVTKRLLLSA